MEIFKNYKHIKLGGEWWIRRKTAKRIQEGQLKGIACQLHPQVAGEPLYDLEIIHSKYRHKG